MAQNQPAAGFKEAIGIIYQAQSAGNATKATATVDALAVLPSTQKPRQRSRRKNTAQEDEDSAKRRCVSSACVACRYVYAFFRVVGLVLAKLLVPVGLAT